MGESLQLGLIYEELSEQGNHPGTLWVYTAESKYKQIWRASYVLQDNPRRETSPSMHPSQLLWSILVKLAIPGELPLISVLRQNSRTDVKKRNFASMSRFKHTDPTPGSMEAIISHKGKKCQLHPTSSGKEANFKKSCVIGQSTMEGAERRLWCNWVQWSLVTTDSSSSPIWYERYRHPPKSRTEEKCSQSFNKVINSGRKVDVDTHYCSLIHILGLLMYRVELKTFKMQGSTPDALKQILETGHYGETAKGLNFMLDSVATSWRRSHEMNVYTYLKH